MNDIGEIFTKLVSNLSWIRYGPAFPLNDDGREHLLFRLFMTSVNIF